MLENILVILNIMLVFSGFCFSLLGNADIFLLASNWPGWFPVASSNKPYRSCSLNVIFFVNFFAVLVGSVLCVCHPVVEFWVVVYLAVQFSKLMVCYYVSKLYMCILEIFSGVYKLLFLVTLPTFSCLWPAWDLFWFPGAPLLSSARKLGFCFPSSVLCFLRLWSLPEPRYSKIRES